MRRLSVFEYETVRVGGRTAQGQESPLRQSDLDALARFNDSARRRFFSFGYRSVSFTSMVGYLEVGDLAIEVLPKADRAVGPGEAHRWRDALLAMLEVALGVRLFNSSDASQSVARWSLFDLVAAAFARELAVLVQEGLARSYRTTESNGPTFRGRLMVAEHIRANVARDDRVYVRFSTFDRDVPVNQAMAAALEALLEHPLAGATRSRLAEVAPAFADLSPLRVDGDFFNRLALGRSTARYARALALARLILERRAPSLRSGGSPVFAMMFDMNILWELYVASIFRRACGHSLGVRTQTSAVFWRSPGQDPAIVRPDIVLYREQTPVLICDTKWKLLAGSRPHDDHLKQMFVYNELLECPHAVLLHPRCEPDEGMTGTFATPSGRQCSTATLGLFTEGKLRHAEMVSEVQALVARFTAATAA